jgi:hypothetical protein
MHFVRFIWYFVEFLYICSVSISILELDDNKHKEIIHSIGTAIINAIKLFAARLLS